MAAFFDAATPTETVTHSSATFELPIRYFRDDFFGLVFAADRDAVMAAMPSDRLHPVRVGRRRAAVFIGAFNYIDTSIGPYGEVTAAVPAVYGKRPLPLLPALLEARYPGFGSVVLHLPVTNTVARDAGRGQWGYPKFVADMQFDHTPEHQQCRMSEGDAHILTLRVGRGGRFARDNKPLVTYTVKDGDLLKTVIPQAGAMRWQARPRDASLKLGDHPVADAIRSLGLDERPLLSRYYVERSGILPAGEVVERGVRPLDGYWGSDRAGVHSVKYEDGAA